MSNKKGNYRLVHTSLLASGLLLISVWTAGLASDLLETNDQHCSPSSHPEKFRKDYRLGNSTAQLKWHLQDNYENHMAPALDRLKRGDFSTSVIGELDWTLARWPNHYAALQALIAFDEGGGRADKYVQPLCYFQRAIWFAPDDANILVLEGIYHQRKRQDTAAEESWKRALLIDSTSVEAHYNLGLLYFRQGDYPSSLSHARIAYELGYPLPGLKKKLIKEGYWD